jgi:serine O-acetyltransferase
VVGIPGRAVTERGEPTEALEHGRLPDPVNDALRLIIAEQSGLAERLRRLEESLRIQKDDETPEKRGDDPGMAHG